MPANSRDLPSSAPQVEVHRAGQRFRTSTDWLESRHSFSFGPHYDARNTHFGLLLVSNDDVVRPGAGFDTHPHRDMEIITWVLEGALVHQDSTGHRGVIYPGLAQRMSAGTGILHSERNDRPPTGGADGQVPVRFVQMWVPPDEPSLRPGYEQAEISGHRLRGGLVLVASGRSGYAEDAAVRINQRDAALYAARLEPAQSVDLPAAPYVHLFVARGDVELEAAGRLATGDAARLTASDGPRVTAVEPAEVLVWEMHARIGG